MTEGKGDDVIDVRAFIDVDDVVALSDDLALSRHVRQAWAARLRQRRGVTLAC